MFTEFNKISFNPKTHTYTNMLGEEYLSVNKMISKVQEEFPKERIAFFMAKEQGVKKENILESWETNSQKARDWGTKVHDVIEHYHNTMEIKNEDKEFSGLLKELNQHFIDYSRSYQEVILYSDTYKVAGRADKVCIRTNRREKGVIDLYDYKTGIEEYRPKNRKYLSDPLSFIEDSKYNHDCLQLSSYALMVEEMLDGKVNIGKLGIVYIDKELKPKLVPVAYMKLEVERLFKRFGNINLVPEIKSNNNELHI